MQAGAARGSGVARIAGMTVTFWLAVAVVLAIIYVPVGVLLALTGAVSKRSR